jgi:hypothetical protein
MWCISKGFTMLSFRTRSGIQTSSRRKSGTISKTGSRFSPGTLGVLARFPSVALLEFTPYSMRGRNDGPLVIVKLLLRHHTGYPIQSEVNYEKMPLFDFNDFHFAYLSS